MTASAIQETIRQWEAEPGKAIMKPTVTGRSSGTRATIEAGPFSWNMDLPQSLGGTNEAASPIALLLGSLAGCTVLFIKDTLAPQLDVAIDEVEATVTCTADGRGSYGLDGAVPHLQDIALAIQVKSSDTEAKVEELYSVWLERCPIYLALIKVMEVHTTLKIDNS